MQRRTLKWCYLASDGVNQDFLDVKVLCDDPKDKDQMKVYCSGSIHLTPHVPFLNKHAQTKCKKRCRIKRKSELMREETLQRKGLLKPTEEVHHDLEEREDETKEQVTHKARKVVDKKEKDLADHLGWMHAELGDSNCRAIQDTEESACLTDEAIARYDNKVYKAED